jgi:TIR domain
VKLSLFISYSRRDRAFAELLSSALAEAGQKAWLDAEQLPPWVDWREGVRRGIERAGAFAFVISPDSLASEMCMHELEHALAHDKRIIALLRREPNCSAVPDALTRSQWVWVREGDDLDAAYRTLLSASSSEPRENGRLRDRSQVRSVKVP